MAAGTVGEGGSDQSRESTQRPNCARSGAPGGRAEILRLDDDEPAARGAGAGVGGADAAARAAAHSLVDEVLLSVLASCER